MNSASSSPLSPVYIVATGVITAIGEHTGACWEALQKGQHGIRPAKILKSRWGTEIPVAEVQSATKDLLQTIDRPPGLTAPASWPRTAVLSAIAVQEILARLGDTVPRDNIGFFSANTVGGMDLTEEAYPEIIAQSGKRETSAYRNHECGAVTDLVAQHFGLGGFITTISTACSSSANSIMMAAQMIRTGRCTIAIAGGADALCRFTLNGFNALGILDRQACQPFDAERRGLNLGEGAGYLLLVNEEMLPTLGLAPLALVSGWANSNDAYHQTASSPDGIGNALAMRRALQIAALKPEDISAINLHGTGTANNDSAEGKAIDLVFGENSPPATSTKSYTGHTLGAAGGVEAVFSVLSLLKGALPATLRWSKPMEDTDVRPVVSSRRGNLAHIVSNSFGFGGNCSSLILSRIANR